MKFVTFLPLSHCETDTRREDKEDFISWWPYLMVILVRFWANDLLFSLRESCSWYMSFMSLLVCWCVFTRAWVSLEVEPIDEFLRLISPIILTKGGFKEKGLEQQRYSYYLLLRSYIHIRHLTCSGGSLGSRNLFQKIKWKDGWLGLFKEC